MSRDINQYAVYRLRENPDYLRSLKHQPYHTWREQNRKVTSDLYEMVFLSRMEPGMPLMELRRQLEIQLPAVVFGSSLAVSDVLAVTKDGITWAYYADPDRLVALTGFFHTTSSSAVLSLETTDYRIEGRPGNWLAADEIWIDGQHFFLMQSQEFGKHAAYAVLDSNGKPAAEDTAKGFSEAVIEQIREYIQRQNTGRKPPVRTSAIPALEKWQKSYENGEYLRSAEMIEEQNYSMIDGRMNNISPKEPAHQKLTGKRLERKRPLKRREPVLKRLREYQDELAMRRQGAVSRKIPELKERRKS